MKPEFIATLEAHHVRTGKWKEIYTGTLMEMQQQWDVLLSIADIKITDGFRLTHKLVNTKGKKNNEA